MITIETKHINFQREYKVNHLDESETVIFFKVENDYRAYCEDAKILNEECMFEVKFNEESSCSYVDVKKDDFNWVLPKLVRSGHRVAICDGIEF